jgi:hypothetical protein
MLGPVSQFIYYLNVSVLVSYIGGPPVPYNYETSDLFVCEMVTTSLISRLGFWALKNAKTGG